jgi:hypothetical protein
VIERTELRSLPRRTALFDVTVEDDNGRFVHVFVEALHEGTARSHVGYILEPTSAHIVAIQEHRP